MKYDVDTLTARWAAGERPELVFFWGHQPRKDGEIGPSCLSQWYPARFSLDGQTYATAEHWMMAEKARLFEDHETRQRILAAATPAEAKDLGRAVRGFENEAWDRARHEIVFRGNLAKFTQNPEPWRFLLGTVGQVLVEASPVDRIWGIGLAQDDPRAADPTQWRGLNLLGFVLMAVRDALDQEPTARPGPAAGRHR
ncbi:MAG TPA: NADAR family protein [Haliangium sp.]|nr:NADAR family protein [Haliangium sp.]